MHTQDAGPSAHVQPEIPLRQAWPCVCSAPGVSSRNPPTQQRKELNQGKPASGKHGNWHEARLYLGLGALQSFWKTE